jgi:hypothetical protein
VVDPPAAFGKSAIRGPCLISTLGVRSLPFASYLQLFSVSALLSRRLVNAEALCVGGSLGEGRQRFNARRGVAQSRGAAEINGRSAESVRSNARKTHPR